MGEKSMVAKLILDASSYQKGVELAKQQTISLNKEMELWKIKNGAVAGSMKLVAKEAAENAAKQAILTSQIKITKDQYEKVTTAQGENSKAAMMLKNKITDLEIQQAKLNKEIGGGLTPMQNWKNYVTAAGEQIQKAGEKMKTAGEYLTTHITAPAIAAGAGIIALANKTTDYASDIDIMSQKTGLSTKSLQELKYVTHQLDMDFETIQASSLKFVSGLKGVEKGTGDQAKAMDMLKVSIKDANGQTRNSGDIYMDVINKLSGMKNETDRNVMASAIFGKQYGALIPLLNNGAGKTKEMADQAEKLGLVMSKTALEAAGKYESGMKTLTDSFAGAGRQIAVDFMPMLTDKFIPLIQENVIPALKTFSEKISSLITWFDNLSPGVKKTIEYIAGFTLVLGPALVALGQAVFWIGKLTPLLGLLGPAAATAGVEVGVGFTAMLGPIGLVIAALGLAYMAVQSFKNASSNLTIDDQGLYNRGNGITSGGGKGAATTGGMGALKMLDYAGMPSGTADAADASGGGTPGGAFTPSSGGAKKAKKTAEQIILENLAAVTEKAGLKADIAKAQYEKFKVKIGETTDNAKTYAKELVSLNVQLNAQTDSISATQKAYIEMIKVKGQYAVETLKLSLQLTQEQQQYLALKKSIEDVTKAMKAQSDYAKGLASKNKHTVSDSAAAMALDAAAGGHYDYSAGYGDKAKWVSGTGEVKVNSGSGSVTNALKNITFNIHDATDPAKVAAAVKSTIRKIALEGAY